MTRAFNIEGLVRLQNYMGGKTLSDAQFFAVLNADVVEMIDGEESTTKRRYFRIAENDESITFSCILGSSQQQMVVTKATKQLDVTTTEIGGAIAPGSITTEMLTTNLANAIGTICYIDDPGISFPYNVPSELQNQFNQATLVYIDVPGYGPVMFSKFGTNYGTMHAFYSNTQILTAEYNNGEIYAPSETNIDVNLSNEGTVSDMFFVLPADTQLPYTLTEGDKVKLDTARIIVLKDSIGWGVFCPQIEPNPINGYWAAIRSQSLMQRFQISNGVIQPTGPVAISDSFSVKYSSQTLSASQKTQARTNIGAAEDPNTSGDPQATLEEPPVVDEEPIP